VVVVVEVLRLILKAIEAFTRTEQRITFDSACCITALVALASTFFLPSFQVTIDSSTSSILGKIPGPIGGNRNHHLISCCFYLGSFTHFNIKSMHFLSH
jgi:hypothetical protein